MIYDANSFCLFAHIRRPAVDTVGHFCSKPGSFFSSEFFDALCPNNVAANLQQYFFVSPDFSTVNEVQPTPGTTN